MINPIRHGRAHLVKRTLHAALLVATLAGFGAASTAWAQNADSGGVYAHRYAMAERTLEHLYAHSDSLIMACLKLDCMRGYGLDEVRATQILGKIATGLVTLPRDKRLLVFESEKKAPGTFIIDGNLKLAKTGSSFGSPIYYNVDLLYRVNEEDEKIPLPDVTLFASLVHELGHHTGEKDHLFLDRMSIVFAQFAAKLQKEFVLEEDEALGLVRRVLKSSLRLTDFASKNLGPKFPSFNLSLRDELGWHDITAEVRSDLLCADNTKPQTVYIEMIDWLRWRWSSGKPTPVTILPSEIPISGDRAKYVQLSTELEVSFRIDAILDCPTGPESVLRTYKAVYGEGLRRIPNDFFEHLDIYYYLFDRLIPLGSAMTRPNSSTSYAPKNTMSRSMPA